MLIFRILLVSFLLLLGGSTLTIYQASSGWVASLDGSIDLAAYEEAVAPWRDNYTAHFPKESASEIDSQARFYHLPHFLQGIEMVQLRLVLSAARIAEIRNEASQTAISTWRGKRSSHDADSLLPDPVGDSVLMVGASDRSDYEVFVLKISNPQSKERFRRSGIAIGDTYKEVVYWFERD